MVILQRAQHVIISGAIWKTINRLLDAYETGKFGIPAEDMACNCAQYLSTTRGEDTVEHRAKIFHIPVLRGKLQSAVRWITDR